MESKRLGTILPNKLPIFSQSHSILSPIKDEINVKTPIKIAKIVKFLEWKNSDNTTKPTTIVNIVLYINK